MKPGAWVAFALLVLGTFGTAQDNPKPEPTRNSPPEVTPETEKAIEKGLGYLAKSQSRNGSFQSSVPVATTSIACLSFMAAGNTPSRGLYSTNIRRGLEYILKCVSRSGYITEGNNAFGGSSGMHGHGFATLFLAEALGMIEDPELYERVHEKLKSAVRITEQTQNQFGGWNSAPDPKQSDDGSGAVAIMQIMALRAARSAGVTIRQETIDKAKKYVQDMTTDDGWYQYNWNSRGGHRSSGLAGPGTYMLGAMELYTNPKYERGIKNLLSTAPFIKGNKGNGSDSGWMSWYYYTLFYASLAIFQHGGKEWQTWYSSMRDDLIKKQTNDGRWEDPYGGLYTAFAVLSLELPYRYLPFFQEGGKGREGQ
jgi:hypothetical protein